MATIDEILTAEDWQEQLSAWIIKLVQEAGAAEHFRQEGAAAERAKWAGYIVWHPGDGSEPHKLIAIGEQVIDAYHEREAVVRYLREMADSDTVKRGDPDGRRFLLSAAIGIDNLHHQATRQDAQGPSSNPPDSEASADSCERKGGSASPDASG